MKICQWRTKNEEIYFKCTSIRAYLAWKRHLQKWRNVIGNIHKVQVGHETHVEAASLPLESHTSHLLVHSDATVYTHKSRSRHRFSYLSLPFSHYLLDAFFPSLPPHSWLSLPSHQHIATTTEGWRTHLNLSRRIRQGV